MMRDQPVLQCGAKEALELKLTPRHIEIALLIAKGYSNRQIAPRLGLSEFTVRNHVAEAMSRIDVPNRTALAVMVLRYQSSLTTAPETAVDPDDSGNGRIEAPGATRGDRQRPIGRG